jgi:S-adenosyl-L-methionine hydrolase (adenosine-forming)
VAVRAERGDVLVGPDNGLLVPAADALGGIDEARELANREWWLPVTSSTFHGRDIFAPVAAHLAAGSASFDALGPSVEPAQLIRLAVAETRIEGGTFHTQVVYVDTFGNARLAGSGEELRRALGPEGTAVSVRIGDAAQPREARFVRTFGEVEAGDALVYVDSSGHPALGLGQGDFAMASGVRRGDRVVIERR